MTNRLEKEASLYLRQHCNDPVDWYPWCDEAFESAKSRDVPIFLSIGYSACHWCHVMAHESFQDQETAEVLNKYFVSIKVDREERPDVDDAYMTAVQLATGHGGWPITVFMTPEKEPFYAGTYYPKESRGDFPGFRHLAASLAQAWITQRSEMVATANEFAKTLRNYLTQSVGPSSPTLELGLIDAAVEALHHEFDFEHGGFGTRPKFPPHSTLRFLLDYASKRHLLDGESTKIESLTEQAGHMALMTLEQIALGGIHDHVGGGFHRYSTDEKWFLPHFEKMLSDNALLIKLYADAAMLTGDLRLQKLFLSTANSTADWIESTLCAPHGTFWTSVDADSADGEGTFYTWTADEIENTLPTDGESYCDAFGVEKEGNYLEESTHQKSGRNILYLDQDLEGGFDSEIQMLKETRSLREHPSIDDKSVAAINGLTISALAKIGRIDQSKTCATVWCSAFQKLGHVPHLINNGLGFLDDYAYLANGLLDLADATQENEWRMSAEKICEQMSDLFEANEKYTYTSNKHEKLFGRSFPAFDSSVPSPLAEAARAIYRLGMQDDARMTLMTCLGWLQRTSRASHSLIHLAFQDFLDNPNADRTIKQTLSAEIILNLIPERVNVDDSGWASLDVVITIPQGMHINSNDPTAKWLTATTLKVDGAYAEASFPKSDDETYRNEVCIPVRLRPKSGTSEFQLTVTYQLCSETECFLPNEQSSSGFVVVP